MDSRDPYVDSLKKWFMRVTATAIVSTLLIFAGIGFAVIGARAIGINNAVVTHDAAMTEFANAINRLNTHNHPAIMQHTHGEDGAAEWGKE